MPSALLISACCLMHGGGLERPKDAISGAIIDTVCDRSVSREKRERAFARLSRVRCLPDDQLARLHEAFRFGRGRRTRSLLPHLERLGNEATLSELLRQQGGVGRGWRDPRLLDAIHGLSKRLDIDPWERLDPFLRRAWEDRGYERPTGRKLGALAP